MATTYYVNEELPGQPFTLYEADRVTVANLASGWTAKVQLLRADTGALIVEQTANITLAATAPNFTRTAWTAGTLAAIVTAMGADTTIDVIERPVITSAVGDEGIGNSNPVTHTFKSVPV
jgi:hypothetical protein